MTDRDYAIQNLLVLRENIAAFASYAQSYDYDKMEAAQRALDEFIETI